MNSLHSSTLTDGFKLVFRWPRNLSVFGDRHWGVEIKLIDLSAPFEQVDISHHPQVFLEQSKPSKESSIAICPRSWIHSTLPTEIRRAVGCMNWTNRISQKVDHHGIKGGSFFLNELPNSSQFPIAMSIFTSE
jgi:hypothetical protein